MRIVTKDERENWIINIENTSSTISSQLGSAVVDGVFQRYGAHSVEDLNPRDLPDVFSETPSKRISDKGHRPEQGVKRLTATDAHPACRVARTAIAVTSK